MKMGGVVGILIVVVELCSSFQYGSWLLLVFIVRAGNRQ